MAWQFAFLNAINHCHEIAESANPTRPEIWCCPPHRPYFLLLYESIFDSPKKKFLISWGKFSNINTTQTWPLDYTSSIQKPISQ